jgi:small subunit ribosomal protein S8
MSLTDPVADFLARIRNAIRARHQKLDVPASKLKAEIARILKEEGYISNYKTQEEDGKAILRVYLKYGANNEAAIRDLAHLASRLPCLHRPRRDQARPGRPRHLHHDHPQGRHDRPSGPPRRRWRRDPLRSLVGLTVQAGAFGVLHRRLLSLL